MKRVWVLSGLIIVITIAIGVVINDKELNVVDEEIKDVIVDRIEEHEEESPVYDRISDELPRHPKKLQEFERIEVEGIKIKSNNYILLDLNKRGMFKKGHLEGAINIPVTGLEHNAEERIKDKDVEVITYHDIGKESLKGALILKELGYTNIINLGGKNRWGKETLAVEEENND